MMKKITKTEREIVKMINYSCRINETYHGKLDPDFLRLTRNRIKKEMIDKNSNSEKELLKILKAEKKEAEKKAHLQDLELFDKIKKTKEFRKLPQFVKSTFLYTRGIRSNKILKKYSSLISQDVPGYIEREISAMSYSSTDWGRLRKTYEGINIFHCDGIRTEDNGRGGYKKVVWHYADFFVCFNKEKTKGYYKLSNGNSGIFSITKNGTCKPFDAVLIKPNSADSSKITGKNLSKIFNKYLKLGLFELKFDKKQNTYMIVEKATNEEYHISRNLINYKYTSAVKYIISNAISAFKSRRDEKLRSEKTEKAKKYLETHLNSVFVSISDSKKAGNCDFGTRKFAEEINIDLEKIGGVVAAEILENRNDQFTQRACIQAALKFVS